MSLAHDIQITLLAYTHDHQAYPKPTSPKTEPKGNKNNGQGTPMATNGSSAPFETLKRFVIASLVSVCGLCLATEKAAVCAHGQWESQECTEVSDLKGFKPVGEVKLGNYGGWLERKEQATGFFHTAQINGRWWLVDPKGYLFLCVGVNSVNPALPSAKRAQDKKAAATGTVSADRLKWAGQTLAMLREHGFNMLGCWSDTDAVRKLSQPMPYCLRWGFMGTYRQSRKLKYPETGKIEAIYPFDPEFERFCDEHAKGLAETRNDPWLLGHFSDNELPFHESGIVQRYLSHPPDDPCHEAAARFMASRKSGKPGKDDDRAFLQLTVNEYYRKVAAAIRKHDPNHLFLGSRFHGQALASPALFAGAGSHADIISVNYYNRWTPENDRISNWAKLAGKPILITEWYAQAADSGLPNNTGAGFHVETQSDRAKFYQHFTLTLLQNPACVGWHWFKYRDGSSNNPGIVNANDEPYAPLLKAMKEINTQVYPLTQLPGR